jgi:phage baseplate assembly protein W
MTIFRYDPNALGTDIAWTGGDLDPTFSLVSGIQNLKGAALRRLITARGELFYERGYGLQLEDYVNADVTRKTMVDLQREIRNELLKDERFIEVDVTIEWLGESNTMKIKTV